MIEASSVAQKILMGLWIPILVGCGGGSGGNSQSANSVPDNSSAIVSSSMASLASSEASSQLISSSSLAASSNTSANTSSFISYSSQSSTLTTSFASSASSNNSFSSSQSSIASSSHSSSLQLSVASSAVLSSSSVSSSSQSSSVSSSSIFSSSKSSSLSAVGRDINNRLEGERNERTSGVWYDTNNDDVNGQHVAGIEAGDYVEWDIYVPAGNIFKLTSRSATLASSGQQIEVDGVEVAELGLPATGSFSSWQSFDSVAFRIEMGSHKLRIKFTTALQVLTWVKLSVSAPNASEDVETGLWRLVNRETRMTLTRDPISGVLLEAGYSGNIKQQWRIKKLAEDRIQFKLESSGECLTPLTIKGLTACENASGFWAFELLRSRSEDRPAIYRLRSLYGGCLVANTANGVAMGSCDDHARWYLEPVGYDERSKPVEYEVRSLLLIKEFTNVAGLAPVRIAADIMAAASTSYERDVALWFKRMTDGRVVWKAETVISPNPITSFSVDSNVYLPAAVNVQDDVQRYVPIGKYDTATLFFTPGNVSGGWGWGPGSSKESHYTLWATVNGGTTPAAQWISGENEPTEVFIHEPMHGFDAHFDRFGLPLPEGYLHGAETNKYTHETDGWMPWYRDYWLGTVIASDDTYRGYGPRMFRQQTVRSFAAAKESVAPGKIVQLTSGMCLATKNGVIDPSAGMEVVFSLTCNTAASSFQLRETGMLEYMGSSSSGTGYCVHPAGGTAGVGSPLVLWPACSDPGLPVQVTSQSSIQNIKTGLCIHPMGGASMPADGTSAVYWSGCEADALKFKFTH